LYLIFAGISGIAGTALSIYIRATLAVPNSDFLDYNYHLYNVIVTGHAFIMIFFHGNACAYRRIWELDNTVNDRCS
jgi:heme/copper-type cytochrome/quinol oxidase subunit 1